MRADPSLHEGVSLAFVIPCLNEEASIAGLVSDVMAAAGTAQANGVSSFRVIVVDNGSTDATTQVARDAGAEAITESRRGYGRACLTGVEQAEGADLVVLMDGDRSDQPAELPLLLDPILADQADLVIGSRLLGNYEPGSLLPQQIFGNRVATFLLRLTFGVKMSDIGPFRIIRREALLSLGMQEMTYGWSIEMIARAAVAGLRIREVPVSYRKRSGGVSKVSGNVRASAKAGVRIIGAIFRVKRASRTHRTHRTPA